MKISALTEEGGAAVTSVQEAAVRARRVRPMRRGDFGAEIHHGQLLLPEVLMLKLALHDIRTAEHLALLLRRKPSIVADALDWTIDEVQQGATLLLQKISDYTKNDVILVDSSLLEYETRTAKALHAWNNAPGKAHVVDMLRQLSISLRSIEDEPARKDREAIDHLLDLIDVTAK